MIGLSTSTYDLNGAITLNVRLDNPYQTERRGTVSATLDISSTVYDWGYSVSDASYTATMKTPSKSLLSQLNYLIAYYPSLIVSTEIGVYAARVKMAQSGNGITLTFRLITKLDS